jgi:peroxiredoxin
MLFNSARSCSKYPAIFWLGVNAIIVALVVYEATKARRPDEHAGAPAPLESVSPEPPRGPQVGQLAPDFSLPAAESSQQVSLAGFRGKKPVVLIFGSCTCPVFRQRLAELNAAYQRFHDQAEFLLIYVREAHPLESGHIPENAELGPIPAPKDIRERSQLAMTFAADQNIQMPLLVDDMDDSTARHYDSWPERLYVVGLDGKIAYAGSVPGDVNVPAMIVALDSLLSGG